MISSAKQAKFILFGCFQGPVRVQKCGIKYFKPAKTFDHIEMPENPKLRIVPKVPTFPNNQKPIKMRRFTHLMRGPELVHNKLIYGQYGIIATEGGRMKHSHFEVIRLAFLKKLDYTRMFAVWRVDPPWQSCTKRPVGLTLGGGKPNIHHYVTPVKKDRVIVEVGGKCEFAEIKYQLQVIANKMPFDAKAVSVETMEAEARKERELEEKNINPYTYEYLIKNNIVGCRKYAKKYDFEYFGKYL